MKKQNAKTKKKTETKRKIERIQKIEKKKKHLKEINKKPKETKSEARNVNRNK